MNNPCMPVLMSHMIHMLGTGNAFLPHTRMHSFAMIDGAHLIDAPPTALACLRRQGVKVSDIKTIFITHTHGDHVFGFPFLLLERKYVSDPQGNHPLTVIGSSIVRNHLIHLCRIAFPSSLDTILNTINWIDAETGTTEDGWSWNRFPVHHDDAVDPHGYSFQHRSGASFVHSGDSGPCEALYEKMRTTGMTILEMGFPNWVPSTHHHKPNDVEAIAQQITSPIFITHTYLDGQTTFQPTLDEQAPQHPPHVHHLNDGDILIYEDSSWTIQKM